MVRNIILTLSLAFLFFHFTMAQWNNNPDENMVLFSGSNITSVSSVKTSNNNIFVSYFYKESSNYNLYVQLLDSDGFKLWEENGLLISSHPQDVNPEPQQMLCDNNDNLILLFADTRQNADLSLFCYKLSQDGDFLWGNDGMCIFENNNNDLITSISAYYDSENEIIASISLMGMSANSVSFQRILSDETLPWGIEGKTISNAESQQVFSTGEHIVVVFKEITGNWMNPEVNILYQLFDKDGTQIFTNHQIITDQGGITMWDDYNAMMTNNNQTIVTWHDDRYNEMRAKPYAQNIDVNGNKLWAENGVCLSQEEDMNHFYPMAAGQGMDNEVVLIWQKSVGAVQFYKSVYGQKVSMNGNLEWGPDGKQLLAECSNFHRIQGCIMNEDNLYVAFGLHPTEGYFDTVYTHLGSYSVNTGNPNWLDPVKFASSDMSKGFFNLPMIDNNQVVITWMEGSFEAIQKVKGQNIFFDGTMGLHTGISHIEEDNISLFPNPANDYFQLNYDLSDIRSVLIVDAKGIVVYNQKVVIPNQKIYISGWQKGLYFVRVRTKNHKIITSKLIKN